MDGVSNEEWVIWFFRDYLVIFKCIDGLGVNLINVDIDVDLDIIIFFSLVFVNLDLGDLGIIY